MNHQGVAGVHLLIKGLLVLLVLVLVMSELYGDILLILARRSAHRM